MAEVWRLAEGKTTAEIARRETETFSESQRDAFLSETDVCDWKDIQLRSTTTCSCHGVFIAVQTSTEPDLLLLMY